MKKKLSFLFLVLVLWGTGCSADRTVQSKNQPELWLSRYDGTIRFQKQNLKLTIQNATESTPAITINPSVSYQQMDGFGFALTGGSASLIHQLDKTKRTALLQDLFSKEGNGIGTSYLRISIGASDLSDHVFSYCDLPEGQTDTELKNFNLGPDKDHLIPLLKEIQAINPDVKIMGSPWSPPVWMKTNGKSIGGSLKPEFYTTYANYFVKYIQAMAAEGITIDAITVQNEPLHPGNNPSLLMLAPEQAGFVKNNLGSAFRKAGIQTKIIVYDHNADRIDYPMEILKDESAAQYIDGSAFHLYGGEINALSQVHQAFPTKNLYFTEQWVGAPGDFADNLSWHVKNLIIGASRNWCKTVIEWNLGADPNQNPHTEGGCTECLGAITVGSQIEKNVAYYIIAHAAKFVRPGSTRIESNLSEGLPNVAFKTPEGKTVLVVMNETQEARQFTVRCGNKEFPVKLDAETVATLVWKELYFFSPGK